MMGWLCVEAKASVEGTTEALVETSGERTAGTKARRKVRALMVAPLRSTEDRQSDGIRP